jgi:hypothetical protein
MGVVARVAATYDAASTSEELSMNERLVCAAAAVLMGVALAGGCEREKTRSGGGTNAPAPGAATRPAAVAAGGGGDHANRVDLGERTVNGLKIKAMQDEPVKAGGEGAFDLVVTGYPAGQKPKAVRFWVGTEAGTESAKAKAAEESPDNWHTHADVPNPMPAGSKFWAEIEPAGGEKFKVSFELKGQ